MSFVNHVMPPNLNANLGAIRESLRAYRAGQRARLSRLAAKVLTGDILSESEALEAATILDAQFEPPPLIEQQYRGVSLIGNFLEEISWAAAQLPLLVDYLEAARIELPREGTRCPALTLQDKCNRAMARNLTYINRDDIWSAAAVRCERSKVEAAAAAARRLAEEAGHPLSALSA